MNFILHYPEDQSVPLSP